MYLELKNINFSYGENVILKNVNFGVEKGEITGLIGANGAGKTTIIYNIVKKLIPKSGEILLNGKLLKDIQMDELNIAYIPDEPVYYEELCDKYIMICAGEVIAAGSKQEIAKKYGLDSKKSVEELYLQIIESREQ